jgi:WD40 repeat protein
VGWQHFFWWFSPPTAVHTYPGGAEIGPMLRSLYFLLVTLIAVPLFLRADEPTPKTKLAPVPAAKPKVVEVEKVVRYTWFPRFSPDGKWLLTAHGGWDGKEGGEARVWNVETGEAVHVIKHPRGVRSVTWSPSGKYFVTGAYDGVVRFFDAQTGKPQYEQKFAGNVEGVCISQDESTLVTTHGNGDVRVIDLPGRKVRHVFKAVHAGGIWGVALSPSGQYVATAGKDTFVRVFDLKDLNVIYEFKHPGETNGVAFTRDNRRLLTGCADAVIRVFDLETGKPGAELKGHERGSVADLQFSSDNKLLASAGNDRTVRLWNTADLDKPKLVETLREHDNTVFGVAVSPDDALLASVDWSDKLLVWDLKKKESRWIWQR